MPLKYNPMTGKQKKVRPVALAAFVHMIEQMKLLASVHVGITDCWYEVKHTRTLTGHKQQWHIVKQDAVGTYLYSTTDHVRILEWLDVRIRFYIKNNSK